MSTRQPAFNHHGNKLLCQRVGGGSTQCVLTALGFSSHIRHNLRIPLSAALPIKLASDLIDLIVLSDRFVFCNVFLFFSNLKKDWTQHCTLWNTVRYFRGTFPIWTSYVIFYQIQYVVIQRAAKPKFLLSSVSFNTLEEVIYLQQLSYFV